MKIVNSDPAFDRKLKKICKKMPHLADKINADVKAIKKLLEKHALGTQYSNHKLSGTDDIYECHLASNNSDILLYYLKDKVNSQTRYILLNVTNHDSLSRQIRSMLESEIFILY